MALPKFDDLTKTYCDFVGKDEFPALGAYTIKVNSTTAQKTKLTVSATKTGDLLSTSLKGKHAFKDVTVTKTLAFDGDKAPKATLLVESKGLVKGLGLESEAKATLGDAAKPEVNLTVDYTATDVARVVTSVQPLAKAFSASAVFGFGQIRFGASASAKDGALDKAVYAVGANIAYADTDAAATLTRSSEGAFVYVGQVVHVVSPTLSIGAKFTHKDSSSIELATKYSLDASATLRAKVDIKSSNVTIALANQIQPQTKAILSIGTSAKLDTATLGASLTYN